ncbi:MAG: glucokinase [Pseudomonadales bacterium]
MTPAADCLIADVGATHARFCRAVAGRPAGEPVLLATGDYRDAADLVAAALRSLTAAPIRAACFAVAGPLVNGRVEVTNGGLAFDTAELERTLGCRVKLVNDFFALATAIPLLEHFDIIGGDPEAVGRRGVKAVLGPGSGLGMSALLPEDDGGWRVLASEGGHADLAPGNHLEQELLSLLMTEHGTVCWETVLSGPGLVRLHQAVCQLWGLPVDPLTAEEISRRGVDAEDPVCHQTLEMFFGLLGAAAGNLALTVCADAGVYIGGGIVPALAGFARTSPLRRRFEERAELDHLMKDIPLLLILDEHPGLLGAAACLNG